VGTLKKYIVLSCVITVNELLLSSNAIVFSLSVTLIFAKHRSASQWSLNNFKNDSCDFAFAPDVEPPFSSKPSYLSCMHRSIDDLISNKWILSLSLATAMMLYVGWNSMPVICAP
jgi:hypothetical protein